MPLRIAERSPSRRRAPAAPSLRQPALLRAAGPVLQRAPSCACGGGCPRCQAGSTDDTEGAVLQRQVDDGSPATGTTPSGMDSEPRDAPDFGEPAPEPGCPPPTQLGRVAPDPPCEVDTSPAGDDSWLGFEFCTGSDVLLDPAAPGEIRAFARNRPSGATFTLHAYASIEGNTDENANLSCYRARRIARDLQNAGVAPDQIEITGKGPTSKFDVDTRPGMRMAEQNLRANRRVVLDADRMEVDARVEPPPPERLPDDATPQQRLEREVRRRQQLVDAALQTLRDGRYRLAADAYLSRWTCGEFPTLRQAVARTEVRIEGEPEAGGKSGGVKGFESNDDEALDMVVLNDATFRTADPLGCVIARIVDLTFHLKTRPHLADRGKRHQGGSFMVELAGFMPCADRVGESLVLWFPTDDRATADPLAAQPLPPCAVGPLEGALESAEKMKQTGRDLGGKPPAEFAMPQPMSTEDLVEPTPFGFDLQTNLAVLGTDPDEAGPRVKASAEVQASGDASVLPHYRIGFIRTIGQEDATVEYVNGMTLRRSLPTPLRDASEGDPAPWFDFAASQVPAGSGDTTRIQTDAAPNPPRLEFPFAFLTSPILANRAPEKDGRRAAQDQPGRLPIDPVAENVVRRVTRRTEYLLWVAARRDDAPLDRFHTRFLDTNTMTVTQAVDVGVVGGGNVRFEGDARVHGVNSGPGQEPFAQLDGAGPAAFAGANGSGFGLGDRRVVSRGMPTPREQSPDGLDSRAYRARVNEIVTPLRQELGLTQELAMHIALDPKSGRMLVPGIAQRTGNAGNTSVLPSVPGLGLGDREAVMSLPVHVIVALNGAEPGPFAARFALDALAQRFYLRTRGELVLSTPLQAIEVTLPALPGTPRTFPHLHEVPGALAIFREVWREFAKDCRLERSATIIVDRRNGALRRVLRVGQPMKRSGNQVVHSVPACIQPSEGGENRLDVHETVLGVVHTHPDGIAPSLNDAELLKEMHGLGPTGGVNTPEVTAQVRQRLCGNELYTLLRDAHGDVVALNLHPDLPRSKELGPILGDIEGC